MALQALTQGSCTLDEDLAKQLETYRAMKKGNLAPEISFITEGAEVLTKEINNQASKLSDLKADYKLVVFGASWCPKCADEIPKINNLYSKWYSAGMDVVFISLDDSESDFKDFATKFDFLSYCDYKKWGSPVAEDYYVFSTPTMFLLDIDNRIRLRPNSVRQVDAWVDWNLLEIR